MNIKRKHHFVSQFYLRHWSDKGKIIAHNDETTHKTTVKNIAFETSFYRICPLTLEQIRLFDKSIEKMKLTELSSYNYVFKEIMKTYEVINLFSSIANITDLPIPAEAIKNQTLFSNNFLEDKFSREEEQFSKVLNKVINDDDLKLTLYDYDMLMLFFVFQLTKTPQKIKTAMQVCRKIFEHEKIDFTDAQNKTYNLLLSFCMSEGYYLNCLSKLCKITIYRNTSRVNFITSMTLVLIKSLMKEKPLFNYQSHLDL